MWPRIAKSVSEFTLQKADQKATCFRLTKSLSFSLFRCLVLPAYPFLFAQNVCFHFCVFPCPFIQAHFLFMSRQCSRMTSRHFYVTLLNSISCFHAMLKDFFLSYTDGQKIHFHCRSSQIALSATLSILWLRHGTSGSSLRKDWPL